MIYLPEVENIYKGTDPVDKIMLADQQVWLFVPDPVPVSVNTLMFKPNWKNVAGLDEYTGTTFSLFSGNDGILFTDYNGNVMDPINATVSREYDETVQGVRWCTVSYDSDGWARFEFDSPLYGIYCGIEQGRLMPFAVIPSNVRVLGGFYGLNVSTPQNFEKDRKMRLYIPEGVETITGQCVYGTTLFQYGSVHIPSTVTTIGIAENNYNSLYPANGCFPQLFYYNGTYDEYNAIDWRGRITYDMGETVKFAGYPVKCTDGVYYYPKSYGG